MKVLKFISYVFWISCRTKKVQYDKALHLMQVPKQLSNFEGSTQQI